VNLLVNIKSYLDLRGEAGSESSKLILALAFNVWWEIDEQNFAKISFRLIFSGSKHFE
jgi:hypothetical protein